MQTVNRKYPQPGSTTLPAREVETVCPPVDIFETEREVVLEAEMAGVPKDGTQLSIEGDELTIGGTTADAGPSEGYDVVYAERRPKTYRRVFVLGSEVQREKIRAHYDNGLLRVTLPKSEKAQPRKIEID